MIATHRLQIGLFIVHLAEHAIQTDLYALSATWRERRMAPMLVSLADGKREFLFEAEPSEQQLAEVGVLDEVRRSVAGGLSDLSDLVGGLVAQLAGSLSSVGGAGLPVTTAQVQLGIKVDGEGRAFVARSSVGANLTLTLTLELGSRSEPGAERR